MTTRSRQVRCYVCDTLTARRSLKPAVSRRPDGSEGTVLCCDGCSGIGWTLADATSEEHSYVAFGPRTEPQALEYTLRVKLTAAEHKCITDAASKFYGMSMQWFLRQLVWHWLEERPELRHGNMPPVPPDGWDGHTPTAQQWTAVWMTE